MSSQVVLASTSIYRARALERLHIPFDAFDPKVDETAHPDESPAELAKRLAIAKARATQSELDGADFPETLFIGADQVAWFDGRQLPKPANLNEALENLVELSGRTAVFQTAVAVLNGHESLVECVETLVELRSLSAGQLQRYVNLDEPVNCAGGFKVESAGIGLFSRIESSDPTALEGLPLIALVAMLSQLGYEIFS